MREINFIKLLLLFIFTLFVSNETFAQTCGSAGSITSNITTSANTCAGNGSIKASFNATPNTTIQLLLNGSILQSTINPSSPFTFSNLQAGTNYQVRFVCSLDNSIVYGSTSNLNVADNYMPISNADIAISNVCTSFTQGGTITVNSVTGGNEPYQYSVIQNTNPNYNDALSTYSNNPVANVSAFGTYQIRIKDACGNYTTYTRTISATIPEIKLFWMPKKVCGTNTASGSFWYATTGANAVAVSQNTIKNNGGLKLIIRDTDASGAILFNGTYDGTNPFIYTESPSHKYYIQSTNSCGLVSSYTHDMNGGDFPEFGTIKAFVRNSGCGAAETMTVTANTNNSYWNYPVKVTVSNSLNAVVYTNTNVAYNSSWSTAALPLGTYTVTYTDQCGNTATETVNNPTSAGAGSLVIRDYLNYICSEIGPLTQTGTTQLIVQINGYQPDRDHTTVTITAGPSNVGVNASLWNNQYWGWTNVIPGTYTIEYTSCGTTKTATINVAPGSRVLQQSLTSTAQSFCSQGGTITSNKVYNGSYSSSVDLLDAAGNVLQNSVTGTFNNIPAGTYSTRMRISYCASGVYYVNGNTVTITNSSTGPIISSSTGVVCEDAAGNPSSTGSAYLVLNGVAPLTLKYKPQASSNWVTIDNATLNTAIDNLNANTVYDVQLFDGCGGTSNSTVSINTIGTLSTSNTVHPCLNKPYNLEMPYYAGASYVWTNPQGSVVSNNRIYSFANFDASYNGKYTCKITWGSCVTRYVNVTLDAAQCNSSLSINAVDDNFGPVDIPSSTLVVGNVFTNDKLNGAAVTAPQVIITPLGTIPSGIMLNTTTGEVSVNAGTPVGTYTFKYKICEVANASNCDDATVTVQVALVCSGESSLLNNGTFVVTQSGGNGQQAFVADNNVIAANYWQTTAAGQSITIDYGQSRIMNGLTYYPSSTGSKVLGYTIQASTDNATFVTVATGSFPNYSTTNLADKGIFNNVIFTSPVNARYLRMVVADANKRVAEIVPIVCGNTPIKIICDNVSLMSSGSNATATDKLPVRSLDNNWTVFPIAGGTASPTTSAYNYSTISNAHFAPAVVVGKVINNPPFVWASSPFGNAEWISATQNGQDNQSQGLVTGADNTMPNTYFYKYKFNITDPAIVSSLKLRLDYYVDNNIVRVYVNGVDKNISSNDAQGYLNGHQRSTLITSDFVLGANELVVQIFSTPGFEGLLVQGIGTCPIPGISVTKDGAYHDTDGNGVTNVGDQIKYNFVVTNTGNTPLTNVTIEDNNATVTGGPLAVLPVGASNSTTFTAIHTITAADIAAGFVYNLATVKGTDPDGTVVTDTSSDPTPCASCPINPSCPDCTITPINSTTAVDDTYNTTGNTPVSGNVLTNDIDLQGHTLTVTSNTSPSNGTVIVNADGSFTYTPNPTFTGTDTYTYTVCDNGIPQACDVATVTINVAPATDLSITKTVNNATPTVGSNVTFTITATNNGPSNATGVSVTENIPSGYEVVSITPSTGSWTAPNWSIGNLVNGASATLTVVAKVKATGVYANTVTISGNETDPTPGNNTDTETPNPAAVSDLAITKTVNNATPSVGSNVTFTITATNNGPSAATGVSVTENIPSGYEVVSVTPGTGSWTAPNWSIGNLANGASATLTVVAKVKATGVYANTVTISGNETDPTPGNNTDTEEPTPSAVSDLSITKTVNNATPTVGSNVTFTITATNNGPSNATGVSVTENIPTGYEVVSVTPSTGSWTAPNWSIGNLANGASATLTIVAKVKATGVYANTVTISGNETDPTPGNNTDTETPNPAAVSDLAITKTVNNATPTVGSNVTFTITATNNGPSAATGVSVTENIPTGYEVVSVTPSTGSWTAPNWSIGNLANGASATLTVVAKVKATGVYANTVTISGNETDPTPGNNTNTVTPIPKAVTVDLSIVKSTPLVVKSMGEQFNYDLTVRNNSTNPATEVMVEDVLPNGLVFISATSNNGTVVYNPATRTLSWNVGQLAAGASVSLNLNVKTDQAGVVVNTATVSSKEEDTNPADNTSTATKEILGFKIPNVITPDGDGKNDTFRIQGLSAYPENSMVIFNRWGNEVFHSDGAYQNNWTGEGLNAGTYYYLLKIKDSNGNWHAHKGFITLLKKN
ncbi:MAG: DUF11 domain-containing protein [Flavobacteriales bacterium]|nr:MAG: DUF11 domain-containing protein [Flavobacteriales bacterium]